MKFVDSAVIDVASGNGAPGAVIFRREKYKPKMGPDGGNGGKGGDLYFQATTNMQSLLDFRFQPTYHAQDGEKGRGSSCDGPGGADLIVKVPVGTTLFDSATGEFLADLVEIDEKLLLFKGGRGGLGNKNFATPVRQAPDFAQPGEPGTSRKIRMDLKLLADVALLGFPNAGKSTFISKWSAARPKVADYPFTTLIPNLGVVRGRGLDFVLADIPGVIEGASEGRGLGLRFLKHCERSRLVLVMVDLNAASGRKVSDEYQTLLSEMQNFSTELFEKKRIVLINKIDLAPTGTTEKDAMVLFAEKDLEGLIAILKNEGTEYFLGSAATGEGLDPLKNRISDLLLSMGPAELTNRVSDTLALGNQELLAGISSFQDYGEVTEEGPEDDEGSL
jgi:GTP-binding protein